MTDLLWPEADDVPYDSDPIAQGLIRHGEERTLGEIGALFDASLSREAVRQIEVEALRKVAAAAQKLGIPLRELHSGLGGAAERVWPEW